MDNTNRNFNGQQANEEVVAFTRHHWILVFPYLLGVLVLIFILGLSFLLPVRAWLVDVFTQEVYEVLSLVLIFAVTYFLHRIFTQIFNYYLRIVIITNFRVIDLDKTLVFNDTRDALDLSKVQDVILKKDGLMQTLFNYGDLELTMPAVNLVKTLKYVPNPDQYYHKLNEVRMRYTAAAHQRSVETNAGMSKAGVGPVFVSGFVA